MSGGSYDRVHGPLHTCLSWSWDGIFNVERSRKIDWLSDAETTERFEFPAEMGRLEVRFDFVKTTGVVEISSIVLRHSAQKETLIEMRSAADWKRLRLASHLVKVADSPALKLLILDQEPRLDLPAVEIAKSGGTIECEIRLRVCPGVAALAGVFRQVLGKGGGVALQTWGAIAASGMDVRRLTAIENTVSQSAEAEDTSTVLERIRRLLRRFHFSLGKNFKAAAFRCHIESPAECEHVPAVGCITGWIAAIRGDPFLAVRACSGGHVWMGNYFLHRPDVAEAFPSAGERCGFGIPYEFSDLGTHHVYFEALTSLGGWIQFARRTFTLCVTRDHETVGYAEWLRRSEATSTANQKTADGPLISVVLAVDNPTEASLRRAIGSILSQTSRKWELCIANDASTKPSVRKVLDTFAAADGRIKIVHRVSTGGVCASSNSALELATGQFTTLFAGEEELAPTALAEIAQAITLHPGANCIYCDDDKIDATGTRYDPQFKSAWQPDLLLGQNCLAHLTVYRTGLLREVGGFRVGYEGGHDRDLALRVIERIPESSIVHIPRVLCHCHVADAAVSKNERTAQAIRRALAEHLERTGQDAELIPLPGACWRVRHALPANPPKVSIIIPTRNCAELLRMCVDSLLGKTAYPDFEIILVDNGSDSPGAIACLDELSGRGVKIIRDPAPFNFSALNNRAVAHASGTALAFLNNDLEVITPGWLAEMVSHAMRPGVGAVGAMLYYPDDRVQHAGVVLGTMDSPPSPGVASHVFPLGLRGEEGWGHHLNLVQNYSAVTAACMVIRREIFDQLGGFNETDLAVAFNDVDFCLRVRAAGYRNVWTPFAELYHHESASRGRDTAPENAARYERERRYMREKWGPVLDDDPAYHPNLTLLRGDFSLAWPPRPVAPARAGNPFQSRV